MFITRPSRRLAQSVLWVSPSRSLSITTSFAARPRPRPAPRKPEALTSVQNGSIELQLPPIALLKSARKSSVLDIEPDRALNILRDYAEISTQRSRGTWEKRFCAEENVTARTLVLLALILTRCKEEPRHFLGRSLLFSASILGEPFATIFLMESALKGKHLDRPIFTAPFAHLRTLAAPPHSNVTAMVLLGKIYQSEGAKHTALQLFRQAALTIPSAQEDRDTLLPLHSEGVASALVHMGKILKDQGNAAGAKEAFRKAALELDDPNGYYHLAQMEGDQPNESYLAKSAASGNIPAALGLGRLYLVESRNSPKGSASEVEQTRMAKEWYYLAASAGDPYSMLHLAEMLQGEGRYDSALTWIKKGENLGQDDVAEEMKKMRERITEGLHDTKHDRRN